jgi:hypothetical protein
MTAPDKFAGTPEQVLADQGPSIHDVTIRRADTIILDQIPHCPLPRDAAASASGVTRRSAPRTEIVHGT